VFLFDLTAEGGAAIVDLIEGAVPRAAISGTSGDPDTSTTEGSSSGVEAPAPVRRAWIAPKHDDRVFHPQPSTDDLADDVGRTVTYEEFKLQSTFGAWLAGQETPAALLSLPVGRSAIQPDFHVPARSWIVEAKKSEARKGIASLIGLR
jgi:hypothetical protein